MGKVAQLLGKPFMPWQQYVADVILELDPVTMQLVYSEVGLTVPRQSGKSTLILADAVQRCTAGKFWGPRQKLVYTAQTRNKAREKWQEDYLEELKAAKAFRGKFTPSLANGNEHIRFKNRSRFGIESTTEKAGHGSTLDKAYLDEAFALVDNRSEQGFRPTMITRPNTQLWWVSTAGWSDGSPYLQAKVARGRELVGRGVNEGLAYFEWSVDEDADPESPETWRQCMPALGFTVTEQAIAAEFLGMDLNDFKRAYCNMWVPRGAKAATVIDMDVWEARGDEDSTLEGRIELAADATPDRTWAAIGAAGERRDGLGHIEVVKHEVGIGWVVDELVRLQQKLRSGPVPIDGAGPLGSLIPDLDKAGVKYRLIPAREYAQSCGAFYDDVIEDRIRHIDQAALTAALDIAKKRPLGDAWAWARKTVNGDISPLVAVTLARHSYRTNTPQQKSPPLDVAAHGARPEPARHATPGGGRRSRSPSHLNW